MHRNRHSRSLLNLCSAPKFLSLPRSLDILLWLAFVSCMTGLSACNREPDTKTDTLALIPMGSTDEFWKSVHAGGVQASQKLGVNIIWQGPIRRDDRTAQIDVVENMIVRG